VQIYMQMIRVQHISHYCVAHRDGSATNSVELSLPANHASTPRKAESPSFAKHENLIDVDQVLMQSCLCLQYQNQHRKVFSTTPAEGCTGDNADEQPKLCLRDLRWLLHALGDTRMELGDSLSRIQRVSSRGWNSQGLKACTPGFVVN
jgi:hypothetical protein